MTIPLIWLYLIGNTLTQYVCISSVFVLTTECTSLTVTLVLTLRKFLSLIISIIYFKNPFTLLHWAGTIMVFAGTLLFTNIIKTFTDRYSATRAKKSEWTKLISYLIIKLYLFIVKANYSRVFFCFPSFRENWENDLVFLKIEFF